MENEVKKTGIEEYHELLAEAKALGIKGHNKKEELEKLIAQAKTGGVINNSKPVSGVLSDEERKKIEAKLQYEFEAQEKFKVQRQIQTDRASIIVESESLKISVDLPDNPTELQLAKARQTLGIKKIETKPSPETVRIEGGTCPVTGKEFLPSKKGYYIFTNLKQADASHTVSPGGKYTIHLIPGMVHVISEYHTKFLQQRAVTPIYKRVSTGVVGGPGTTGQMGEECKRVGSEPRFSFNFLADAPSDAPFGPVFDQKILEEVMPKEEQLM